MYLKINSGPIHLMILMALMILIGLVVFMNSCSSGNDIEKWFFIAPMYALLASVLLTGSKLYEEGMVGLAQGLGWTLVFAVTLGLGFWAYAYIWFSLKTCGTF